ncbi:MAG: hypothetical protein FJ037_08115 [Chloroflexi bacterium]|nr:hypothetical protein [Chloroflexota bacterium]
MCILIFAVLSEVEIFLVPHSVDVAQFGARLLWFRIAYVAIFTVASPGFPAQWMYPTIVALQLIAAPGQFGGRGLAFLTAVSSTAYLAAPHLPDWGLDIRWQDAAPAIRPATEVWCVGLVALPLITLALHIRQQRVAAIQRELAATVSRLSAAQEDLGASKEQLERWNHALHEEVERQTGRFWVRSLIPTAVSAAWERKFLGTPLEDLAARVEARATASAGTPAEEPWRALVAAIREESGDRRCRDVTEAA